MNAVAFGCLSRVEIKVENYGELFSVAEFCNVAALKEGCQLLTEQVAKRDEPDSILRMADDLDRLGFAQRSADLVGSIGSVSTKAMFLSDSAVFLTETFHCAAGFRRSRDQ